jgi:hypothetical protein
MVTAAGAARLLSLLRRTVQDSTLNGRRDWQMKGVTVGRRNEPSVLIDILVVVQRRRAGTQLMLLLLLLLLSET